LRCPTLDQLPPPPSRRTGWPWTEASPRAPETTPGCAPWPRVSIVTPSFNQGHFIEETIRSVLLQGYPDLEFVIMDGGSTDGTLDIIRKYEPWITQWVSQPDGGQTRAINHGWSRTTGPILAYVNSDDCYLPGAVAAAALEFCRAPSLAMVYGTASLVDESGSEVGRWEARPFDLKVMLTSGSIVPQPATFFAREAVSSLGMLNERRRMIMDYELCTLIGMHYPTACVPDTFARFRTHPHSKTWLYFEITTQELLDFLSHLSASPPARRDWKAIRRSTLSRIHYECAKEYVGHGQAGLKSLRQLLTSFRLQPGFALTRPVLTAHIVKRSLLDYFAPVSGT
jgi:glycosyltransferase involved in cell wall biosynthesis